MTTCEKCGADLPPVQPGSSIQCRYCGRVHAAATRAPEIEQGVRVVQVHTSRPWQGHTQTDAPARKAGPIGCIVGAAGLLGAIGVGIAVMMSARPTAAPGATGSTLEGLMAPSYTRLAELTPENQGWKALDPAGMPAPFGALEPTLLYPWVLARAQQWAPDATLTNLSVNGASMNGEINATDPEDSSSTHGVNFVFTSPARMQAGIAMRQVSTEKVITSVRIHFAHNAVEALPDTDIDDDPIPSAFPQPACSLAQVIAAMRTNALDLRPAYDLMTTNNTGRWVWWINMTDIDHTPRINADDCALSR